MHFFLRPFACYLGGFFYIIWSVILCFNTPILLEVDFILNLCLLCPLPFSLQYDYEYDEHGERVVLGKGTFGVVYAGRDLSNQVRLAIKEIPERDSRWEYKTYVEKGPAQAVVTGSDVFVAVGLERMLIK